MPNEHHAEDEEHPSAKVCYRVVIGLTNGDRLQGHLLSFSPMEESIELLPGDTNEPLPRKLHAITTPSTLRIQHLAYLAFLDHERPPIPQPTKQSLQQVHLKLLHGEAFHVRTGDPLRHPQGFYAFPLVESHSAVYCYFFYHHAISSKHSSEYIGQLLQAAGHASEEAVQEALRMQHLARTQRLGEILRDEQRLSEQQLREALRKQRNTQKNLGEILVESGLIDERDLARALARQSRAREKKLGQVLIDMGAITELELASALAKKYHLPLVDLDDHPIDPQAIREVDPELVRRYQWLPIAKDENSITMAIADPLYTEAETTMKFHVGKRIRQVIATPSQIRQHIERLLSESEDEDWLWLESLEKEEGEEASEETGGAVYLSKAVDAPPIVRIVNKIILDAHRLGASDIHLLPQARELHLYYRINGELIHTSSLEKWLQRRVISRLKLLANMDISETRLPQDGRLRARRDDMCMDFRVSCMPGIHGESLVLRMLRSQTPSLDEVGLRAKDCQRLRRLLHSPFGLILATGPTGSGKSTTLQALIREVITRPVHVITIEDPVEAEIPGTNQVQVNERIGLGFARVLRNVLRHDPDVVMVGEMRDTETARIGIDAALTGHLILSSLHTNSAVDSIARLLDLGVEHYLLAPALLAVISQSLVRVLCVHCRRPARHHDDTDYALRELLGRELPPMYDKGSCAHCHHSGYSGRRMVYEILIIDEALRAAIANRAQSSELHRLARDAGMIDKRDLALQLASEGVICRQELLRLLL